MSRALVAGILAAACSLCQWAAADTPSVTNAYTLFAADFGPGAPQDPVTGSFTVTFNPGVPIVDAPVDAISLDIAGHEYAPAAVAFGFNGLSLFVDGTLNGTALLPGTGDFFLEGIVNGQGQFTAGLSFTYTTAGSSAVFAAGRVAVGATPVPEPATFGLLLLGLGLLVLGLARRRMRSIRQAQAPIGRSQQP